MSGRGRLIENSLYSEIQKVFEENRAEVVSNVKCVTVPDFIARWLGEEWVVSVKIGDPRKASILKGAFMQYIAHMQDFGIKYGMILFYPEKIRKLKPSPGVIRKIVRATPVYAIVLNPQLELRKPLPEVLKELEGAIRKRMEVSFSLSTVVEMLGRQVEELMSGINLGDEQVIRLVSSQELFFGINPVEENESKRQKILRDVSAFLAAYIFLSQVLFLRLYCEERPLFLEGVDIKRITRESARELFGKVKDVNYRPIFEIDVLHSVPEKLIQDTFRLLFGLKIKGIRYELPGRLFHELMPKNIRKLLAAFYTRPVAAHILAQLTIDDPDATILDPACGSGTILTMAYRRKLELWRESGREENPHRLFCEKHIFGCDIMPFAVHLTNANLIAMDPLSTVDLTQIALGDSLKLAPSTSVPPGFISLAEFMPGFIREEGVRVNAFRRTGEVVEITLSPVKVVLMNPPFTKVERGIKSYIDASKFENVVGSEVGLWGHFVALADAFLEEDGIFGAVLPINLLRGRESEKVRELVFRKWLPLYIIKASRNYGFSEYAEYRDVLVIAKKTHERPMDHRVKFCIIKKNLNKLTEDEAKWIAEQIKRVDHLRSELLDIDSYMLNEVSKNFDNLMPLISGPSLEYKDALRRIIAEAEKIFRPFPQEYFKEGYGPRPKGVSGFMFITRPVGEARTQEAFLILERELENKIVCRTPPGIQRFEFDRGHFLPCLRTPVGLNKIDVTGIHDYVAKEPYENIERVIKLCDFKGELPKDYWSSYITTEFKRSRGHAAVIRRINPYSPSQMLIAFYSETPLVLANVFHVINDMDNNKAKAVTVLLNSIFFLAYFFNVKEETTGRYTELRHYDLCGMKLFPKAEHIDKLVSVYEKYKDREFPSLREQLDVHFDARYTWFWKQERESQETLLSPSPIEPHPLRLDFDMDIIRAVGARITREELLKAYEAIVWDMIITRGLKRD